MKEGRKRAEAVGTAELVENGTHAVEAAEEREGVDRRAKKSASALLWEMLFGLSYAIFGYLLGACALPFGAYPLGVAWLCAAERRVPYVFVGLCLSALGLQSPVLRLLSYALALGVRVLVRLTLDKPWKGTSSREHTLGAVWSALFSEQIGLRMTTACLAVFFVGVYRLFEGGFLYYDLWGTLLALGIAPVATLLFSGANGEAKDARSDVWHQVGILSLACALVYASRDLLFAYVSVSAFGAMGVTLYMTKRRGIVCGVLTGALCGLAYMPALAPLFAFGALAGGLLLPVSATFATLVTIAVSTAWAFYARGLGALSGLLPAILAASVLFAVADKLFALTDHTRGEAETVKTADAAEMAEESDAVCEVLPTYAVDHIRLAHTASRVKTVCESFSGMAEIFEEMGKSMQAQSPEALRAICDNAFDSSCASCEGREGCWEASYRDTDAEIDRLSAVLYREGRVTADAVDEALLERCSRLPDIVDEINHNARLYASRVLESDKTEIFALDYASMAEVLAETMTAEADEYETDEAFSARLCERFRNMHIGIGGVLAWGKARRRVAIFSREALSDARNEAISETLSEVCGERMIASTHERREDGTYETVFSAREHLRVRFARRTARAEGEEEFCGDSIGVFCREGVQYAFISDGMGAGREAALTSGICALFLQKMLTAGNRCETVLRMLNGFLRNKGSGSLHECSATVDLMALDLHSGEAGFYKCGAAPTYVLRDGSLFKLRSKTLPIGILREPDRKRISFEIREGDVIVMVSDGVTQGREECPWLFDLLRRNVEQLGIEETADRIVRYARDEGSTDDLSVLILAVERAEKQ